METSNQFEEWVGRSETLPKDILTPRLAAEFSATCGDILAPVQGAALGLHWCIAPPAVAAEGLGHDGHPKKGKFLPPVSLPRRMWASGALEFYQPLQIGDEVEKTSTIKNIAWKRGRSGELCFVTVQHEYSTARGLAIREDQDIVYREAATGPASPSPTFSKLATENDRQFDDTREFDVNSTTMFRYSAITFNGHRIHYDFPYATDVEHYAGLVIHGPLQATLLLNFAASLASEAPKSFQYRGVAPATGEQKLNLGAISNGGDLQLAVLNQQGVETMKATAKW